MRRYSYIAVLCAHVSVNELWCCRKAYRAFESFNVDRKNVTKTEVWRENCFGGKVHDRKRIVSDKRSGEDMYNAMLDETKNWLLLLKMFPRRDFLKTCHAER